LRAVVQRVTSAHVDVGEERVATMGRGLLALVGVARGDTPQEAEELAQRIVHLRIFADAEGRMNRSLHDIGATLGVVSQFTLLADARKGRRPSYADAAPADQAERLVEHVVACARRHGVDVVSGRFRAQMDVSLVNHGPVTILLDTQKRF
jgi:D-tyrosyl-tRNA(Tyr) deacylase